ncbi:MAG: MipA/OmpV family protein [Pseudomonadota bacterium]
MARTAAAAITLLLAVPAAAQDAPPGFFAGGLLGVGTDIYVGDNDVVGGVPLIGYRGDGFSIGTNGASVTLFDRGDAALDVFAAPRFFALTDVDEPELEGIDRDITLDIGLRYVVDISPRTTLDLSFAQEVTGEHDGQEVDARLSQSFQLGAIPLSAFAGLTWQSDDLSRYVYGVLPGEVRAGRPAYDPGATTTPYVGLRGGVPLSERAQVIGSLRVDFLGSDIEDSPIVDEDTAVSLGLGVQFSF